MYAGLRIQVCFRIQHIGNCVFFTCGVDHYPRGDRSSLPTAARDTLLTTMYAYQQAPSSPKYVALSTLARPKTRKRKAQGQHTDCSCEKRQKTVSVRVLAKVIY